MRFLTVLAIFCFIVEWTTAQSRSTKDWLNYGSGHVNQWLQIAPAAMGPNALPVPDMDYALVGTFSSFTTGAHHHNMPGDEAVNSYFNFKWNLAPNRVTVSFWGMPTETFNMNNDVRTQRQIYWDDEGWTTNQGDLWISTHIQLLHSKKMAPDMVLNYTFKTTTGVNDHARYTDAPMHYFYLALGKSIHVKSPILDEIRLAAMSGFYVWQTNKVEMAQDEGPLLQGGLQLRRKTLSLFTELGGYKGYDAYEFMDRHMGTDRIEGLNDPLVYRFRLEHQGRRFGISGEYQAGIRDYAYQTVRLNVSYRWASKL